MTARLEASTRPVVTLGEGLGLLVAAQGGLEHANVMELRTGGAEANVAIGLARLGQPAHWIGRVGDDSLGRRVLREIRAEEVAVTAIVDPDAPTGLMLKEQPWPGSSRISYYRSESAGSRLRVEDLPPAVIETAALLHLTGITPSLSESAAKAVDKAVECASAAGVPISFDINHRVALWGRDTDPGALYRKLIRAADVVFAGSDEASLAVGSDPDPRSLGEAIALLGPSEVIVKLGARGAVSLVGGEFRVRPAVEVEVVDTVGAGDAFVAAYLAELLAGADPDRRLKTAVKAGAYACRSAGDWESLPRRGELDAGVDQDPVRR